METLKICELCHTKEATCFYNLLNCCSGCYQSKKNEFYSEIERQKRILRINRNKSGFNRYNGR